MAINFANINLEVIDINTNSAPDIYINMNGITFSRRVLEDMNYPQTVQYCSDPSNHIFAVRSCKSNESRATAFSKGKQDQTTTLSCNSKNLKEVVARMIPDFNDRVRYKVTGEYDPENRVMYFDMTMATPAEIKTGRKKAE